MSKKLAAQALESLLSNGSSSSALSKPTNTSTLRKKSKKTTVADPLPATKSGLKKIKYQLRYGHSVKRNQDEREAKENPLRKLFRNTSGVAAFFCRPCIPCTHHTLTTVQ